MCATRREFLSVWLAAAARAQAPQPVRLARKDSFFGLHFDLHPDSRDTDLGRDVSEALVESLLRETRPDYVQYDAKGHPGWLGWPSRVGPSAPGIVNDSLAVWRRVTARNGVALYIHFSGVWDSLAVTRHPDWARVDAEGKTDTRQTSTFGPYADELMIPQLREAAEKYDLDGAWVDGECWATQPDYSARAAAAYRKATGRTELPENRADPGWLDFLEFNREQFRRHVRHVVDELHKTHPRFQIASNWLYSTYVPEKPTVPVDFLSGDYLGNASISRARLEARYLSATGKPWDLMAWGFQQAQSNAVGHVHKPAVQLQQEAAVVLSQGGGFQIYYQPSRAGHFEAGHVRVMSEVGRFCRARQAVSHKTESVPQAGVVFCGRSLYRTTDRLFGGWGRSVDPARGWLDALLECHYSVDVLPDWSLAETAGRYPLIVLPDWPDAGEQTRDVLLERVRAGGRVLVSGAENAALFREALGIRLADRARNQTAYAGGGDVLGNMRGLWQDIEIGEARLLEQRYAALDSRRDGKPAAVARRLGDGELVCVPGPVGSVFAATHAPAIRQFLQRLTRPLFEPMVRVEAPPTVELALRRKENRLLLHLSNTTGMQVAGEYAAIDFVPAVGPLRIRLRTPAAPRSVRLEPEATALAGEWRDGVWTGTLDRLHIHGVVVFEG